MAAPTATLFSTETSNLHPDQTEEKNAPTRPTASAADAFFDTDEDREKRSNRHRGLAIGAPLTAAFIGGALVFENLTSAAELSSDDQESGALTETDRLASLEADDSGDIGQASRTGGEGDQAATEVSSNGIDDLAPAASKEQSGPVANGALEATQDRAVSGHSPQDLETAEEAGSGGSGVGLSFVSIDVNGGDAALNEGEVFVDEPTLGRKTIVGTSGDDVLEGTDADEKFIGADGDDTIFGQGGKDLLYGNEGNDELHGGTGRDQLFGGSGNDFLEGGQDDDLDLLYGGIGDDILIVDGITDLALERSNNRGDDLQIVRDGYAQEKGTSAEGTTFVFGGSVGKALPTGAASDTQSMSDGVENLAFEGDVDYDVFADDYDNRLYGNNGDNLIFAGRGDDILEGGAGDDRLLGGRGNDDISGGSGADYLEGGDNDDSLRGGAGDDILVGGSGEDVFYGEAGNDTFVLGLNDVAVDSIFDHEGANRLVLEGVVDETIEASLLGNDLYVTADQTPIAMISDYVGNESSLAGIDFGQGLKSVEQLLVDNPDLSSTIADIETNRAEAIANDPLHAHDDLNAPTTIGTNAADGRMPGTDGDDWLSGLKGKDSLYGFEGNDILEGGGGNDLLRGGAGNDQYLFSKDEIGTSTIDDVEGQNYAKLEGFGRDKPNAEIFNNDLRVYADNDFVFKVENYVGNEESFIGIQSGQTFYETDELFA